MRSFLLLLLLTAPAIAAPVPKAPPTDKESPAGQVGLECFRVGGTERRADGTAIPLMVLEINKDAFTITATDGGKLKTSTGGLRYDAEAKSLELTDLKTVDAAGRPVRGDPRAGMGYLFDGEKSILAGKPGPKGVIPGDPTKPDEDTVIQVFVRSK